MLIFMSGFSSRFLGPRAAGMVLAGRILSGSGRVRGAPDSGRVLDVPLAAEQGPRRPRRPEGRECPRGDAPLFTTLRRSAAGSAASVHQQNMRKIPRPLIFGRAERESPAPYLCVCSKMDGFAPLHGVTYCTGIYRVPVGVFLPVRLCGRGRRFDVALARQLATTS